MCEVLEVRTWFPGPLAPQKSQLDVVHACVLSGCQPAAALPAGSFKTQLGEGTGPLPLCTFSSKSCFASRSERVGRDRDTHPPFVPLSLCPRSSSCSHSLSFFILFISLLLFLLPSILHLYISFLSWPPPTHGVTGGSTLTKSIVLIPSLQTVTVVWLLSEDISNILHRRMKLLTAWNVPSATINVVLQKHKSSEFLF